MLTLDLNSDITRSCSTHSCRCLGTQPGVSHCCDKQRYRTIERVADEVIGLIDQREAAGTRSGMWNPNKESLVRFMIVVEIRPL